MSEKYIENNGVCVAVKREIFTKKEVNRLLANGKIRNLENFNILVTSSRNTYRSFGARFVDNYYLPIYFREPQDGILPDNEWF